ncbi:hypothetical protein [Pseudanabaena sp. PCC 6802]|uniref:hypothetical protein n=1 Tax=Pseudanabaena sp. PCC 6802 TaxID=118173 RepID=UPI00034CCA7C|nr:hypothetical protein [Pseudanabaena sp. PCC 6802]
MANISISNLYPSEADSLLAGIDDKEGDLIKSAVNRALDARGGLATVKLPIKIDPFPIGIIALPPVDLTTLA